jgi:4-hydroxybenzoate polyprenyltransferase
MKFGLVFFIICGIIVISIFGWTIGLLILIPAGILCLFIFSLIGGVGNFIDDRIDYHHDRKEQRESDFREREPEFKKYKEKEEYVDYEYRDEKKSRHYTNSHGT